MLQWKAPSPGVSGQQEEDSKDAGKVVAYLGSNWEKSGRKYDKNKNTENEIFKEYVLSKLKMPVCVCVCVCLCVSLCVCLCVCVHLCRDT